MKITNIKEEDEEMIFQLKESHAAMANAIRRATMREIPTMAVTEIDFFKNDGSMPDEYLANRIGLIPITTPKNYKLPEECEDPLDPECSTTLTLTAEGPGTIYASTFESEDPKVKIIHPKMPITKLNEGQEMELEAIAKLGKGKEHARHKPCLTTYNTNLKKPAKEDPQTEFQFTIETYCEKKPREILKQSLNIIKQKAEELEEQIKEK